MLKTLINSTLCMAFLHPAMAQMPFQPVPAAHHGQLVLPEGMKFDLLFGEGDTVTNSSKRSGPSKGNHDLNVYIPLEDSRRGKFYTSHEENSISDVAGDGGGGTVYEVEHTGGKWISGKKYAVDFSGVGGTYNNCSGTLTPRGTILTTEESPAPSNALLYRTAYGNPGFRDTSDYKGLKRYQNMGWVVEVDPVSRKAMHKLYAMGRFSHEGLWIMPDKKTVYLADDNFPAVFFKFVANTENDFTEGQLYAFRQGKGAKGSWIALPMDRDSLVNIRDVALRKGATVYARMEWITAANGKLYITETGFEDFKMDPNVTYKGELAYYIKEKCIKGDNLYDYPYGALIEFDPESNVLRPLLFGGKGIKDPSKHFSNPDGITFTIRNDKTYLVINEDLIGISKGRVDERSLAENKWINEVWWLDLSAKNPTVDHLERFMIIPPGAESTGGCFTPDGSTYFVNIQHPSASNAAPFNRSWTIAVTGFGGKKKK